MSHAYILSLNAFSNFFDSGDTHNRACQGSLARGSAAVAVLSLVFLPDDRRGYGSLQLCGDSADTRLISAALWVSRYGGDAGPVFARALVTIRVL